MKNLLKQLDLFEAPLCRVANQKGDTLGTRQFFRIISRLGDGVFWYTLMALLPVFYGKAGINVTIQMLLVGLCSTLIYKGVKHLTVRERPCDFHIDIHPHGARLDQYSFPSGHTMHAVGFTGVLAGTFPEIALLISPFVMLVAWSRLILGLHYPSDILAGGLIGALVAGLSFQLLA